MVRGKLALGILVQAPQITHAVGAIALVSTLGGVDHAQANQLAASAKVRVEWEDAASEWPERIDAAAVVASEETADPASATHHHHAAPGAQRHEIFRATGQVDVAAADPIDDVGHCAFRVVYDAMQVRVRQR